MTAAVPAPLRFPAGIAHTAVVMQKLRDWGSSMCLRSGTQYPKADSRDLLRALQILLADGPIERASPLASARLELIAGSQRGLHLTEAGAIRFRTRPGADRESRSRPLPGEWSTACESYPSPV